MSPARAPAGLRLPSHSGSCCPSAGGFSILTACCSASGKGAVEGGTVFSMLFARRLPALRQGR